MSSTIDLVGELPATFLPITEADRLFYSPSIAGELYTGSTETLEARTAIAALTNLVYASSAAAISSRLALSWRGYDVGSTACMVNFDSGMMGYFTGYNVKPQPGTEGLNIHAEQMSIAKGRANGLKRVIGISVLANPNDADANPSGRATLVPCNRCVGMFAAIPEVDDRTIVLGTDPDFSVCELYTVKSLLDPTAPSLVSEPFCLQSENDLEHYDRNIKPFLVLKMYALYGVSPHT